MSEIVGKVVSVRRFPVKSMLGEELDSAPVTRGGFLGDRAYAVFDNSNGKRGTAKKFPRLFDLHAAYATQPQPGAALPAVRITLPGGRTVPAGDPDLDRVLSEALGSEVSLKASELADPLHEPDTSDWTLKDFATRAFFDDAPVHFVTTATLARLAELHPEGRYDARRFRPNLLVELQDGAAGFVENGWGEAVVGVGAVKLRISGPCPRCVMTTMPQGDLPADPGILRTAVDYNDANVGVYAVVIEPGCVRVGDPVTIQSQEV